MPPQPNDTAQVNFTSVPRKTWTAGTLTYTTSALVILFGWLLFGDFALQLKDRSDSVTAQIVLKKFEASNFLVGLIIGSIPAAIAMLVGPFISVKSDRYRSRWGRRIPFLILPLPVVVLSMFALAVSPLIGAWLHGFLGVNSPGPNVCVLIAFTFFWVLFEFSSAIIAILFGSLINDVVPQEVIGRFFGFFRMVSLVAGILFNTLLIKHVETHFFWIFVGTALFYGIGFSMMCFMVKEGNYPPPEPLENVASPGKFQGIRSYAKECFATPYYLWVFIALIFGGLSFSPLNSFSIFYAKSLEMSMELYGQYLSVSFAVSFVLAYFLGSLADRFHPLRLGIVSLVLYLLLSICSALFVNSPSSFGFAFLTHTIIAGTYYTSMASIGQRLYPKLKFAQFASAAGLLGSVFGLLLPPLMGLIIDASGQNYRLTFVGGAIFSIISVLALLIVYHKFKQYGGPKNYVPPHASEPGAASLT